MNKKLIIEIEADEAVLLALQPIFEFKLAEALKKTGNANVGIKMV